MDSSLPVDEEHRRKIRSDSGRIRGALHRTIANIGANFLPLPHSVPAAGNTDLGMEYRVFHCNVVLHRMQTRCNRYAECAGFGERRMNPLRFIYWWTHHLSRRIQGIKQDRPTASTEEIGFHILDR